MKSWSRIISVIYFLTGVPIVYGGEALVDQKLQLSDIIENQGREYQAKADLEGFESAKTDLVQMIDQNIVELRETSKRQIHQLSQEDAQKLIGSLEELTEDPSENITGILNNRSLSPNEKLEKIHEEAFQTTFQGFKKELLAGVEEAGFEKTFKTMADTLRSRSRVVDWAETGRAIVLIGIPVLIVVFVFAMSSGDLTLAAEVAFGCVWLVGMLLMATNS